MLDLQKLMGQMQGMSEQLQKESQQLIVKLDRAETIIAINDQRSLAVGANPPRVSKTGVSTNRKTW